MSGRVKYAYRRVAAALALLGVAFYALLLPWHLTSQLAMGLYEAEFGPAAALICRTSPSTATDPSLPAFQLAIAPAQLPMPQPPVVGRLAAAIASDDVAGAVALTPRSRGPPLPA
jgi:hypothetical protein